MEILSYGKAESFSIVYGCLRRMDFGIQDDLNKRKAIVETCGLKSDPYGPDMNSGNKGSGLISAFLRDHSLIHIVNHEPCLLISAHAFASS